MKLFALCLAVFLQSCSVHQKQEQFIGSSEIDSILSNSGMFRDTIFLYREPIGLPNEKKEYEFDTIIRVAPFTYADKPSLLLLKIRDKKIYEYDIVYTKYVSLIRPLYTLLPTPPDSANPNDVDHEFAARGYSTATEFNDLTHFMNIEYGEPEQKTDTSYIWESKGISIRKLNNGTTTIISHFSPSGMFDSRHDWEFCSIVSDTFLVSLQRGVPKEQLAKTLPCKDTNIGSEISSFRNSCVVRMKAWGIDGELTIDYNHQDLLSEFVWQGRSTGSKTMIYTFEGISIMIDDLAVKTHPTKSQRRENDMLLYTWSDEKESIYAYYIIPSQRIQIGKASKEFMNYFK